MKCNQLPKIHTSYRCWDYRRLPCLWSSAFQLWWPTDCHFDCADSVDDFVPTGLDPIKDEADLDNFEYDWNYIVLHKQDTIPRRAQSPTG